MRKTLRLSTFDYSTPGAYFVTIATQNRRAIFGSPNDTGAVDLNDVGRMIEHWWTKLPQKFPSVSLDAHVVMPDHFHGLILFGTESVTETTEVSLSRTMQWFKTMTTNEYLRRVHSDCWPAVGRRLWQRGFYDHIVRNQRDLEEIRAYVEGNPGALWERVARRTRGSAPTTSLVGDTKPMPD